MYSIIWFILTQIFKVLTNMSGSGSGYIHRRSQSIDVANRMWEKYPENKLYEIQFHCEETVLCWLRIGHTFWTHFCLCVPVCIPCHQLCCWAPAHKVYGLSGVVRAIFWHRITEGVVLLVFTVDNIVQFLKHTSVLFFWFFCVFFFDKLW